MDKVDRLYQIYGILQDSGNVSDHEAEYLEILQAAKGDSKEKKLAGQFIPKFFKEFPNLSAAALDAQLDLAEDEDVTIRKLSVKHLPNICKESKGFVTKVADILSQMLQSEDSSEITTVQTALVSLLEIDVKASLKGILIQISSTEDDVIRKRAIDFLVAKFKLLPAFVVTKEIEEHVLEASKQVFPKLSGEDFLNMLQLLFNLRIVKTFPVQKEIFRIIVQQLKLDSDVTADNITGFIQCVRSVLPYFSPFISSKDYVIYICMTIMPKISDVLNLENGSELYLDVIKLLAELSAFVSEDDQIKASCGIIHNALLKYISLPPSIDADGSSEQDEPKLQFTHIECLLYAFVQLLKYNMEFLTASDNAETLKDLKSRLQFLALGVQNDIKKLQEMHRNAKELVDTDEMKLKENALHTMQNIQALIKDFFRISPTFKTSITLSWKSPFTGKTGSFSAAKRESSSENSDQKHFKKEPRAGRKLYIPPTGKYSSKVDFSFSSASSSSGRGRKFY